MLKAKSIQEFDVRTASGRRIVWGSTDAETCRRDAERSGHLVISIWPHKEDKK